MGQVKDCLIISSSPNFNLINGKRTIYTVIYICVAHRFKNFLLEVEEYRHYENVNMCAEWGTRLFFINIVPLILSFQSLIN